MIQGTKLVTKWDESLIALFPSTAHLGINESAGKPIQVTVFDSYGADGRTYFIGIRDDESKKFLIPKEEFDGRTARQRIEGMLSVLGFIHDKGNGRDSSVWRHPIAPLRFEESDLELVTNEAQLVGVIYNEGLRAGRLGVRKQMIDALGLTYGFPRS